MGQTMTKTDKNGCYKNMQDICLISEMLYEALRSDTELTDDFLRTTLGNIEFKFKGLCKALDYDSVLAKEVTERYAELRKANQTINDLKKALSEKDIASAESLNVALDDMEGCFRAWYENMGWHYASISFSNRSLVAEFSAELDTTNDAHLSHKDVYKKMERIITERPEFDIFKDGMGDRRYIRDTMANKQLIVELYRRWLPDSHITDFSSRSEKDEWMLRYGVRVSYKDLFALKRMSKEAESDG